MQKDNRRELFLGYGAIIYGLYLLFILVNEFASRTQEHWRFFYAFTQQSNIIAMCWFLLFGISAFVGKPLYKAVRNKTVMTAINVYMSITFFIVLFVLNPVYKGRWHPFSSASEFMLHNATTIMVFLYFFLVEGNGESRNASCLYILIYPLLYVIANLIIGGNVLYLDGRAAYAYDFISPNSYGNIGIYIGVLALLIAIFAIFGLLLIKLKRMIDREYHGA